MLDAKTKDGIANARVLLRASIPTGLGPKVLAAYAVTDPGGVYDVELGEGYEVLRHSTGLRVDASRPGYLVSGVNLGPPPKPEKFYKAPDIVLAPGTPQPGDVPPGLNLMPRQPRSNLPWKQ